MIMTKITMYYNDECAYDFKEFKFILPLKVPFNIFFSLEEQKKKTDLRLYNHEKKSCNFWIKMCAQACAQQINDCHLRTKLTCNSVQSMPYKNWINQNTITISVAVCTVCVVDLKMVYLEKVTNQNIYASAVQIV